MYFSLTIPSGTISSARPNTDEEMKNPSARANCDGFITKIYGKGDWYANRWDTETFAGGERQQQNFNNDTILKSRSCFWMKQLGLMTLRAEAAVSRPSLICWKEKDCGNDCSYPFHRQNADQILVVSERKNCWKHFLRQLLAKAGNTAMWNAEPKIIIWWSVMKLHASGEGYRETILVLHKKLAWYARRCCGTHTWCQNRVFEMWRSTPWKRRAFLQWKKITFSIWPMWAGRVAEKIYERHCFFTERNMQQVLILKLQEVVLPDRTCNQ